MDVTKIGKYDILRELGRGAMGIVYEGVDPVIGRKVAIKTIRFDVLTAAAEQHEAQQRFMREARSAGNLSHPSIVTIYEVGEHEGLSYIAMEFIEGESLEAVIKAQRKWPLESVIEVISQIGDALDYAHRNGVVHRDIKPANILVDKDGRPKIVDFGIARISSSSLTQTNTVLGTPSYMAPEQIAGQKVDHRADLFALGAILYELLTFQRAFPGDNVTTVIYKIMNATPPPPRAFDQTLSSGLDAVLNVALAKDPAQRYQSGRDLADDLRNYQQFESDAADLPEITQGVQAAYPTPTPQAPAATVRAMPAATARAMPAATARAMPTAVTPPPIPKATAGAAGGGKRNLLLIGVGSAMALLVVVVIAVVMISRDNGQYTPQGGSAPVDAPPADTSTAATTPAAVPPGAATASVTPPSSGAPPASPTTAGTPLTGSAASPAGGGAAATPKPAAVPVKPLPPVPKTTSQPAPALAKPATSSKVADAKALMSAPDKPSPPPPAPTGRVYDMTDVDERPRVIGQVEPIYPPDALKQKLQDVVVVKVLVSASGRVDDVQILRQSAKDPAFNAAAVRAVRQYTFAPARKKGQPVSCWFNIGVPFQIAR